VSAICDLLLYMFLFSSVCLGLSEFFLFHGHGAESVPYALYFLPSFLLVSIFCIHTKFSECITWAMLAQDRSLKCFLFCLFGWSKS